MDNVIKVGVGVVIRNPAGQILLGQRLGSHGAARWSFPGGHVEFGEALEATATREVLEETGLRCRRLRPLHFTNDVFEEEGRHYVTLFFDCLEWEGVVVNREPLKCSGWDWFPPHALPTPLFLPIQNLLTTHRL